MSGAKRGVAPAVILIDPKYPHNGGGSYRDAACWGVPQVWITGDRLKDQFEREGRIPREERMRQFRNSVELHWSDRPFDEFPQGTTFIGVEVLKNAEVLTKDWEHPLNAVYVFGMEDGSLPKAVRGQCHRFVIIPTYHCLNLQVAVGTVLAHRTWDLMARGLLPLRSAADMLDEDRGFADPGNGW